MINLDEFKAYFNDHDRFSVKNGIKLTELRERYAKVEMAIDECSMNYMGSMHGGLLYTIADVAAGASLIFCGRQAVTLNASTEYIKPAFSGKVIAEGRVVALGKTVSRCEVEVRGEDGVLFCKSHITMFMTEKEVTI